ncbi:uncharacterized protein LOC110186015 [Drosophila serrata]|uniref:uncharacterized protein LOC110186015 n=1 Tax=Drosophila serrata TaxID=7274 RepID=UPI000A1CFA72|nr:uncharacterized protein LOC110186015 [Drosophila serrata]
MKFVLLIALILALGSCYGAEFAEPMSAQDRSLSSVALEAVESLKIVLRNGAPNHGIPVLAPAKLAHKSFKFSTGELSLDGEIEDFVLEGLDEYEVLIMNVDVFRNRVKTTIKWDNVNITTLYKADVGSGYRMQREGGAFFALKDLVIEGTINYSLGLLSKKLAVKDILFYPTVGSVDSQIENLSKYRILNRKMNEIIEEFVSLTINDNTDFVAEWVNEFVTPICNDMIGDRSLSDIIAIITGGGN